MATAESTGTATWQGDLLSGAGTVGTESGIVREQPVTWARRVERSGDTTSPEELLAASHAACYAMALSNALAKAGSPAERLDVSATASFEQVGEGFAVTRMVLSVRGTVPGLDESGFAELARQGEQGCPISNALRGNVEITVEPTLAGA
jgi:osmotically inducible protein OsmC